MPGAMAETHGSQSTPHRPPIERRTVLRMLGVGAVAAAIGIVIGLLIPWFPPAAATQAHTIDTLYYVLIICTVPIFVLVTTVVLFSIWRWRMRPGEERLDGPPIHGNTQLEVIWTALPAALIAALVVYAAIVLGEIGEKKPHTLTIGVTGQQFLWTFSYPTYKDSQGTPIIAYQLYLPVNRPVDFQIHSVDVIHTFWVPAFRLQEDAVPGITTGFRATPDRIGTYQIVCNQLCGYGHSTMRTTLHIVSVAAFNTWLAEHGYSAPAAQTTSVHSTPTRGASRTEVADAAGWTSYAPIKSYAPTKSGQTNTKEGTQ
jgi:cytochrome c oxidase subunit 2